MNREEFARVTDQSPAMLPTEPHFRAGVEDDCALVRQARQGDHAAAARLIQRWAVRVLALCRAQIREPQSAEDIAQETLLRGMKSLSTLANDTLFGGWLRGIALNLCRDWYRTAGKQAPAWSSLSEFLLEEHVQDRRGTDSDALERNEQTLRLTTEITKLPVDQQEVLNLFYFDELTYNEIAHILGVARSTVNARLTAARETLRKQLTE